MEWTTYKEWGERVFRRILPNGLTVAVIPRPGFQKKLAYFVTDFGSIHTRFRLEGREMEVPAGVAHYLEHKMFDLPRGEVSAEFAALGANPNAFTGYDMTAYYFSCTDHFEESLHLLLEFVSTPYFTEESVEKEQGIIGQEIDMTADSPESRIFELLMENMYREHPVRIPILGTKESVSGITPQVLYDCHRAFYTPANMMLCVMGDVDPEQVCSIARQVLGDEVRPTAEKIPMPAEELTCPVQEQTVKMKVAMPMFQIGFKCERAAKGDDTVRQEIVGDLAAEVLFGESSELYLRLYEDGIIDSAFGGGFETISGMGMLSASGDSEEPMAVRDAILAQAKIVAEQPIPEEDFLRMKRSTLGRRIRDLDSFDSTCFRLCAYHLDGFDYFRFPELFAAVSEEEVRQFIRMAVKEEHCSICIIEPDEET